MCLFDISDIIVSFVFVFDIIFEYNICVGRRYFLINFSLENEGFFEFLFVFVIDKVLIWFSGWLVKSIKVGV